MLHWICPECGRDCSPAVRECPVCASAVQQSVLALVQTLQAAPPVPLLTAAAATNGVESSVAVALPEEEPGSSEASSAEEASPAEETIDSLVRPLVESAMEAEPVIAVRVAGDAGCAPGGVSETTESVEGAPVLKSANTEAVETLLMHPSPAVEVVETEAPGETAGTAEPVEVPAPLAGAETATSRASGSSEPAPEPAAADGGTQLRLLELATVEAELSETIHANAESTGATGATEASDQPANTLEEERQLELVELADTPALETPRTAGVDDEPSQTAALGESVDASIATEALGAGEPVDEAELSPEAKSDECAGVSQSTEVPAAAEAAEREAVGSESCEAAMAASEPAIPIPLAAALPESVEVAEPVPAKTSETPDVSEETPASATASSDVEHPTELSSMELLDPTATGVEGKTREELGHALEGEKLVAAAAPATASNDVERPTELSSTELLDPTGTRIEEGTSEELGHALELEAEAVLEAAASAATPSDVERATGLSGTELLDPTVTALEEGTSKELSHALELEAETILDEINQQLEAHEAGVRALAAAFCEQPKTSLLPAASEIVAPPAPPALEWIRSSRPAIPISKLNDPSRDSLTSGPQTSALAGPCLPFDLRTLVEQPPDQHEARKPARLPSWIISLVVATTIFLGAGSLLQYLTSGKESKGAAPQGQVQPVSATPAEAASETHPFARFVEVTGLRVIAEPNHKAQVQYLVVNHSASHITGVVLKVTVTPSEPSGSAPLFSTSAVVPALGPYQSKEIRTDVDAGFEASAIPDWQYLRTDVQITSQQ